MSGKFPSLPRCGWWLLVWLPVILAVPTRALGMELKLHTRLIWGTNDPRPDDGKCTEVDPAIRERLARVFKWRNYYQVKAVEVSVVPGKESHVRLSEKCELEFKLVDDFTLEIKLFGEGKLTKTVRQSLQALRQGELAVLAGDSKEKFGDAWFVVITHPQK